MTSDSARRRTHNYPDAFNPHTWDPRSIYEEERWLDDILCKEPSGDDFFVLAGFTLSESVEERCRRCPVRPECVSHAYLNKAKAGYFGALSPGFRDKHSLEEALEFIANDPPRSLGLDAG